MLQLNINKQQKQFCLKLDITIADKQLVAIGGDSGSGKTTLVRAIAGLATSDSRIVYGGNIWQDDKTFVPPQKRGIGYMPQDGAVFPNMTVRQNLLYIKKDEAMCDKLLDMADISHLKETDTRSLSGGQLQRVALCRAFMRKPTVLLLDEPLNNLHKVIKTKLIDSIKTMHDQFGSTTIFISHNFAQIQHICDRFIVLDDGKIIKDSKTYQNPKLQATITDIDYEVNKIGCVVAKQDIKKFALNQKLELNLAKF